MAKKFSAIHGFHEVFELSGDTYDLTSILQEKQTYVNHNTICFITADAGDNGKYAANHLINEGDKFIVVQNDVFALVGTSENFGENTWRPLLIDGVQVLDSTTEDKINLESTSEYLTIEGDYDETLHTLSVKYGFDINAIIQYVQEHIEIPSPQTPGDGELQFEFEKSKVHTEAGGTSREIEIEQNTLGVKTTYIEEQEQEDPENEGETVTEEVEVEGNFSADTSDAHTVKIHYKGTADRVDWYVDQDTRDDDVRNESTAKKFVYIEPLNEYFQQAGFPAYSACIKQDIISEDSIVFITCGASDATTFQNPEYQTGARFIWTHGKMFSCNTWMPLFTRLTASDALNQLDPPIGRDNAGGRLIIQGAGGIVVDNTNSGTDKIITIDGSGVQGGGSGDRVTWTQIQESGTPIATINVNGESQVVYAPSDGGGGSNVEWEQHETSGIYIATIKIDGVKTQVYAPEGEIGPQGPKGDKGDKGDTGATGPQGPKGDSGVPFEITYFNTYSSEGRNISEILNKYFGVSSTDFTDEEVSLKTLSYINLTDVEANDIIQGNVKNILMNVPGVRSFKNDSDFPMITPASIIYDHYNSNCCLLIGMGYSSSMSRIVESSTTYVTQENGTTTNLLGITPVLYCIELVYDDVEESYGFYGFTIHTKGTFGLFGYAEAL